MAAGSCVRSRSRQRHAAQVTQAEAQVAPEPESEPQPSTDQIGIDQVCKLRMLKDAIKELETRMAAVLRLECMEPNQNMLSSMCRQLREFQGQISDEQTWAEIRNARGGKFVRPQEPLALRTR